MESVVDSLGSYSGQCLCGGVSYRVSGPLSPVTACHCSQCRRTSGHFAAMANAAKASLELLASDSLRWFRSSAAAERGFCCVCGGNVFWRGIGADEISITAGTLDMPTRLHIEKHIFVADRGDYYTIDAGSPQFAQG